MRIKALSYEMDTDGLPINEVAKLHETFFTTKKYDWWYEVLPGDTVIDIGAGNGMFTAKALDAGADKVIMVEPNKRLLKTAIKNVAEYYMDTDKPKVHAVHAAIGKTDIDRGNIYQFPEYKDEEEECKLMSFRELIDKYDLDHIDFLKIDAEGAELNFLLDHTDYISAHVRHMAINVHIDAQYGAAEKFHKSRHKILKPFHDTNRLRFMDESLREKMLDNDHMRLLPKEFMAYITNW